MGLGNTTTYKIYKSKSKLTSKEANVAIDKEMSSMCEPLLEQLCGLFLEKSYVLDILFANMS